MGSRWAVPRARSCVPAAPEISMAASARGQAGIDSRAVAPTTQSLAHRHWFHIGAWPGIACGQVRNASGGWLLSLNYPWNGRTWLPALPFALRMPSNPLAPGECQISVIANVVVLGRSLEMELQSLGRIWRRKHNDAACERARKQVIAASSLRCGRPRVLAPLRRQPRASWACPGGRHDGSPSTSSAASARMLAARLRRCSSVPKPGRPILPSTISAYSRSRAALRVRVRARSRQTREQ